MKIRSVSFVKSAVTPDQYPADGFPEIAFAGRSNVGKSSLINTLIQRRDMVKTSARPGCTQLINFFLVNDALSFVDLPGFGYARVSRAVQAKWQPMVDMYLTGRATLRGVVLLMDTRRDPREEEQSLIAWLASLQIPCLVVLTKADKLSRSGQVQQRAKICARIARNETEVVLFSAKTRMGRETILDHITELLGPEAHGN